MPDIQETRRVEVLSEAVQQLEKSPVFVSMAEKLISVFYDLPAKRSVLSSLRAWAKIHLQDMAEEDREECIGVLQGLAITNALSRATRPEMGEKIETHPIPSRQRRATIIHTYPYPIGITLRQATAAPDATSRFLALLDSFETLVYFLTFTQLSQYFTLLNSELQTSNSHFKKGMDGLNGKLINLLVVKKKLSLGDWVNVCLSLTRFFRGLKATLIIPELPSFFYTLKGGWTPQAEVFRDFVRIRNSCLGHRHGRSEEYYQEICPSHFSELFSLLESMRFLQGIEMIIPTRLKGRQISEGLVLIGDLGDHDDQLTIEVNEDELPENGGLIRLNRSVIIRHETRGYVELFPYFRYQESSESKRRGIYFLAELKWVATPSARPELKKVSFVKLNASSDQKEDDPDARLIIQRMFEPILAPSFAPPPNAGEDPEQSIDLVWREKKERLRIFVGRTQEKLAVLNRIESALNGLILVTGGPGSGKSSFVYHLYESLSNHCPLLHSIKRRDPITNCPEKFLRALIYQCSTYLDRPLGESAYSGSVAGLSESLLYWAGVVAKVRGGRCTILVDGLDELLEEPHSPEAWDEAVEWLPFCTNFPRGVVFIVAARPDQALLSAVRRRVQDRLLFTQTISSLTQDDVASLLAGHLGETAKLISTEDIFRLTKGYPLFLMTVIKILKFQMESGDVSRPVLPPDLLSFPREEYGYMEEIWNQIRRGKDKRLQRMTEYLCCAYEPGLSLAGLRCLLEQWTVKKPMDIVETRELLSKLTQFFIESSPDRYRPFHPCWSDYVQKTVLGQDLTRRHREMASIPTPIWTAADREYWSLHITDHSENAELDEEHIRAIINDDQLLKARLDLPGRGGIIHGAWLRDRASHMSQDEIDGLEQRLLEKWGKRAKNRHSSLSYSQKMELGALFRQFEQHSLRKEAKNLYQELYEERRDPQCLMNKAWVCYQGLDEWEEAKKALETCAQIYGELGDNLGSVRCMARSALLLWDLGIANPDAEALLLDSIREFNRLNLQRDEALARETLGVVLESECRWEEALSQYDRALHTFEILQNPTDLGRVYLNRSIVRLFLEGVKGAIGDLDRAEQIALKQKTGQLRNYHLLNRCVVELLQNHQGRFDQLAGQINSEEKWLLDTLRQNMAIQTWFNGHHEAALAQFESLLTECIQDAWSDPANRINMGFLMVHRGTGGDRERAVDLFNAAYKTCENHMDRLGLALAAEGLRRLGHSDRVRQDDLKIYRNHLERLYVQCPSPFLPCYVELAQPYE